MRWNMDWSVMGRNGRAGGDDDGDGDGGVRCMSDGWLAGLCMWVQVGSLR